MQVRLRGGPHDGRVVDLTTPLPASIGVGASVYVIEWQRIPGGKYAAVYTHERNP